MASSLTESLLTQLPELFKPAASTSSISIFLERAEMTFWAWMTVFVNWMRVETNALMGFCGTRLHALSRSFDQSIELLNKSFGHSFHFNLPQWIDSAQSSLPGMTRSQFNLIRPGSQIDFFTLTMILVIVNGIVVGMMWYQKVRE